MSVFVCIFVIDDEVLICCFLCVVFEVEGYGVIEVGIVCEGLVMVVCEVLVLVVFDLGLLDVDGLFVLCDLWGWSLVFVLILLVCVDESDKVEVLDVGV